MGLQTTEHRLLGRFATTVDRWPRTPAAVSSVAAIVLLGVLDFVTGPDLAFSVFYLLPLSVIGWMNYERRVLPALACLLAALTWMLADIASGARYSSALVPLWNTMTRLTIFSIVLMLLQNLRSAFSEQQELARTDSLTGIRNARALMDELDGEVRRNRRHPAPLSLVYVDVDDFKTINDTLGHRGGDDVLRRVARALEEHTREVDVVGRLGGDEFAIVMPSTDEAGAQKVLSTLPARLAQATNDLPCPVTLSTGCVTFLDAPAGVGEILHAADELMYEAKRGGKNAGRHRVVRKHPATARTS